MILKIKYSWIKTRSIKKLNYIYTLKRKTKSKNYNYIPKSTPIIYNFRLSFKKIIILKDQSLAAVSLPIRTYKGIIIKAPNFIFQCLDRMKMK